MKTNHRQNLGVQIGRFAIGGLVTATIIMGAVLASVQVHADVDDTVTITVPVSCTISGSGMSSHTETIANDGYEENIGTTTITIACNDPSGFAVYAIGYSGNTDGETDMIASTGSSYDIATGTYTEGVTTDSVWGVKLTAGNGSPAITVMTGYDDYHAVPGSYTKVAYLDSGVTPTEGLTVSTTYAAYISGSQPAGTYTGKVKYVLVHPSSGTAPVVSNGS